MYAPKFDYFQKSFLDLAMIKSSHCRWVVRGHFFVCELDVISNLQSNKYTLCINYERYWSPRVWIVEPSFLVGTYPHTYSGQSNQLCLFNNSLSPWRVQYNIVDTIVCWTTMWLNYYEYYTIAHKWVGPEAKHDTQPTIENTLYTASKKKKLIKPQYLKDYPIRY